MLKEEVIKLIKWGWGSLFSLIASLINPINDFMLAIMVLATMNIVMGALADSSWSFRKAFKAFIYLGGYLLVLLLSVLLGRLMHIPESEIVSFCSWITWVMIWFYVVNILRNWNVRQPENKIIAFLYWAASFKMVEKIKLLKEFNEKENDKK
jgi:hypothetical protein